MGIGRYDCEALSDVHGGLRVITTTLFTVVEIKECRRWSANKQVGESRARVARPQILVYIYIYIYMYIHIPEGGRRCSRRVPTSNGSSSLAWLQLGSAST